MAAVPDRANLTGPVSPAGSPQVAMRHNKSRRPLMLLIIVLLAAAFTALWYGGLRNNFLPVNFGEVEPGLYRSGQISRHIMRDTLQEHHIGLVINLSSDDTPDSRAEKSAIKELGAEQVHLGLGGNGLGDPNYYPMAIREIVKARQEGRGVLVHCQSGAQRTGGIIATYRILIEGKSPDEAFAEMKSYGHDPRHNPELIPFIQDHLPEWKEQLAQQHVLPATQPIADSAR
jgi:protein tyrosine phosphatase (PTP) superfamily phosphohydrolase (DUF442 family)